MTSSRRHHLKVRIYLFFIHSGPLHVRFFYLHILYMFLQSLVLQIAAKWLEQEKTDVAAAKEAYLAENCPEPELSGDQAALMVSPKQIKNKSMNSSRS